MNAAAHAAIAWTESGLVPDRVIRGGIRRLARARLAQVQSGDPQVACERTEAFVRDMAQADVAPLPELANAQHYELPAEFFEQVLGRHAKYSCCYWSDGAEDLEQAESDALSMTCRNAKIEDGQSVLDLGCGWGSLSLWIAERYPASRVTAVSNSAIQRAWIERLAAKRSLANLEVITADMNTFAIGKQFDRVVSVEMFEHMRNWPELYRRVALWLKPGGLFFKHVFCHRSCAYAFDDHGPADWMSRHFFSGGMMPSADLPLHFQRDLLLLERHHWSGREYERTANAWLERMDRNRERVMPLMERVYGADDAAQWYQRWRIFFMACAETFAYNGGREWLVGHYLFQRREETSS